MCGKKPTKSPSGSLYFATFIDEASRYSAVQPIKKKSDVHDVFVKYHVWFERKFSCKIKPLHSDGGGEYKALIPYLETNGIESNITPTYTSELNGIAERMNRALVESTRAMLVHSNMPRYISAVAFVHSTDVRNRMLSPHVDGVTTYDFARQTAASGSPSRVREQSLDPDS